MGALELSSSKKRLRRSDCSQPGISRRRRGRGFSYTYPNGQPVRDDSTLERIRALAVPPAWSDVWICRWPNGHIQAVGTDAAGRPQYRYHDQWRRERDREKFLRVEDFASSLPKLRSTVRRDLAKKVSAENESWRRLSGSWTLDSFVWEAKSTRTNTRHSAWPVSARIMCGYITA